MTVHESRLDCESRNRLPSLEFSGEGSFFFPTMDTTKENHVQDDHPITTTSSSLAPMASNSIKLLTGNSHPALAKAVADQSVHPVLHPIASLLTMKYAVWG